MWPHWRYAVVGGGAFLIGAVASSIVVQNAGGLTALWPCNAILVALLVQRPRLREERTALLIGAYVGSLLSCILHGDGALQSLCFPIANLIESLLAVAVLQRMGGIHGAFDKVADVLALIVASAVAPLVSAPIGGAVLHIATGLPFYQAVLNWYGAGLLGLAIVTPACLFALHLAERGRGAAIRRLRGEAAVIFGLLVTVSLAVFYLGRIGQGPLHFTILPLMTLATFRMRQLGAIVGIAIVTVIAAQATVHGIGPIAHAAASPVEQLIFLQFFLATTLLTAFPVAAALAERDARAEEARTLAEQYRAVVENVDKVIFRMDREGRWTYLNPAWEEATGLAVSTTLGRSWTEHVEADSAEELADWAAPVLSGEISATRRMIRFRTAAQGPRWMEISFQALRDQGGRMIGTTGTMRDVEDRKRLEENVLLAKRRAEERAREATMLAATDELTGLANRRAFGRHLERLLDRANIVGGKLALAIFDVDHFKEVNDSYGHAVGDLVLQRIAARALQIVRGGDVVGRLGGEEFGILMPGASLEDARNVAERLRDAIQRPAHDGEEDLPRVTISVGIASANGEQLPAVLSQEADRALYSAKRDGRNRVRIAA